MVLVLEPGLSTTDISILCAVYDFPDDFEAPKEGLTRVKTRLKKLKLRGQKRSGFHLFYQWGQKTVCVTSAGPEAVCMRDAESSPGDTWTPPCSSPVTVLCLTAGTDILAIIRFYYCGYTCHHPVLLLCLINRTKSTFFSAA
jgi:hypothetical protein